MISYQSFSPKFPHDMPPQCGYALLEQAGQNNLKHVIDMLGEVIHVADVTINHNSRSLVTSTRSLDFHTDHPKADYIVWYCFQPANEGGESIIADAERAFADLSPNEQETLAKIRMFEHKVFPDDASSRPLVSFDKTGKRFYYSYWLVEKNLPPTQQHAFDKFRLAVPKHQIAEVKLKKDDILIVDNTKFLHGRRAFSGGKRHLRRYWIRKI